jgi:hypothetical protein
MQKSKEGGKKKISSNASFYQFIGTVCSSKFNIFCLYIDSILSPKARAEVTIVPVIPVWRGNNGFIRGKDSFKAVRPP